jgi:hypothetical protein
MRRTSLSLPTVGVENVPSPLPEQLVVLDVREQDEWDAGHIEGAQHIPLGDLGARLGEVPADRQVLCVCHVGGRSARAVVTRPRPAEIAPNAACLAGTRCNVGGRGRREGSAGGESAVVRTQNWPRDGATTASRPSR